MHARFFRLSTPQVIVLQVGFVGKAQTLTRVSEKMAALILRFRI
jgi:hypothetical protein